MFTGRTSWPSHRPLAAPALAEYKNRLVLVWSTRDGTMYMASGMETDGVVDAKPLPADTSLQRPSLAAHPDDGRLYLGYTRTDGRIWLAWSDNGVDYNDRRPWLQPPIGGPAIVSDNVTFWLGYTEQGSQAVQVVQSQNPTFFETYVSPTPTEYSVDTPALLLHPSRGGLLAWTSVDVAGRHLNARFLGIGAPPTLGIFSDTLIGGPNLFTIGGRSVAGYTGRNTNIYMVFDIDNLDEARSERWKFADTSPWPPAVATVDGTTYVAWFSTGGDNDLNFADLGSMPTIYRGDSG
ncbi:hypothetical protein [Nocardia wallacei]|uniref:Uncharacterized protein n=1 Tax=Nocardia wallacei TaxID=480035 RepID=A0A7G1KJG3_9NOCA|nr:hypothetical protein [Nocardia wallacei]BCK54686.1 hypothetical protein NWFMUON74_24580 [Nocardia wallacei]